MRKNLKYLIKITVSVVFLVYVFVNNSDKLSDFRNLELGSYSILIILLAIASLIVVSIRFQMILYLNGSPIRFLGSLQSCVAGMAYDLIMPVSTGGDALKILYLRRKFGLTLKSSTISVAVDRIYSLIGIVFISLLVISKTNIKLPEFFYNGLAQFIVLLLVVVSYGTLKTNCFKKVFCSHQSLKSLYEHPGLIILTGLADKYLSIRVLFISCINIVLWSSIYLCILFANSIDANLYQATIIVSLGLLIGTLGIAGGFGPGTVAMDYMFNETIGSGSPVLFTLTFQSVVLLNKVMLAIVFFIISLKDKNV